MGSQPDEPKFEERGERGEVWASGEEVVTELWRDAECGQGAGGGARMLSLAGCVFWALLAALGRG